MPVCENQEKRSFTVKELRVERRDNSPPKIVGYAALFNSLSLDLGGFRERIAPGAFTNTLKQLPDVRALIDHDSSKVLGRTSSGTLKLEEDENGLRVEIDPGKASYALDLMDRMERGDINQMSFAFWTVNDDWEQVDDQVIRTLKEVDIDGGDVSCVTYPAYPDTAAAVRSRDGWNAKQPPPEDPLVDFRRRQKLAEADL